MFAVRQYVEMVRLNHILEFAHFVFPEWTPHLTDNTYDFDVIPGEACVHEIILWEGNLIKLKLIK